MWIGPKLFVELSDVFTYCIYKEGDLRMAKIAVSLRIDEEILSWFRKHHPISYQKGILGVLRDHVISQKLQSARIAGQAQELYRQFYSRCFWHLKKDLVITSDLVQLVKDGLRQRGGQKGFLLASLLDESADVETKES